VPQAEDRQQKDFQGDYEYHLTKNETEAEKNQPSYCFYFQCAFPAPQAEDWQLKNFQDDYEYYPCNQPLTVLGCVRSAARLSLEAEDRQPKDFQGDYEYYLTKNETQAE
jgi:hypothetical protein